MREDLSRNTTADLHTPELERGAAMPGRFREGPSASELRELALSGTVSTAHERLDEYFERHRSAGTWSAVSDQEMSDIVQVMTSFGSRTESRDHGKLVRQQRIADKLLLESAINGDGDQVKLALSLGASPNAQLPHEQWSPHLCTNFERGSTALMMLCCNGPDTVSGVQALIDAGADVNHFDIKGANALVLAARGSAFKENSEKDASPIIEALIKSGASPNEGLIDGMTPLHSTINTDDSTLSLSAMRVLLHHGANPNVVVKNSERHQNFEGTTPLMMASWLGPDATEGVKALIDSGADVNYSSENGFNALIAAASGAARYSNVNKDASELINALVEAGISPDAGFPNGMTPLFACLNEYDGLLSVSGVKALVAKGANPNAEVKSASSSTEILTSVTRIAQQGRGDSVEAVKALVEAGARVNTTKNPDSFCEVPLGAAAEGSAELTRYLISQGAETDIVDGTGATLIDRARKRLEETQKKNWDSTETEAILRALEGASQK